MTGTQKVTPPEGAKTAWPLLSFLLVIIGFAVGGWSTGIAMIGVVMLVSAVMAAVRGHGPGIRDRKSAGRLAAVATVVLIGAGLLAPGGPSNLSADTASDTSAAQASETAVSARAKAEEKEEAREAAIKEAEEPLATTESDALGKPRDVAVPAPLPDQAVDEAVAGADRTTALAALAAIEVKGRAPRTGYDRGLFGSGWVDVDRNGCDTRNDMLARDLTGETFKPRTQNCVVLTGDLQDPYSGKQIAFKRGERTSSDVQIDHVVSLSDAWQKGAQNLDVIRRTAFANDPLNLLAVDGTLNMQKGDGDAATWLPPKASYRCPFVARQVAVKATYGLWMTQAEKNAIATVLSSCPDELLPAGVVVQDNRPAPTTTLAPLPPPAQSSPAPRPSSVVVVPPPPAALSPPPSGASYANCSAARAAGAAPVYAGHPGYGRHLDRDGDGVGCES